ncbi:hypothetical protein [Devosia ginsengisoli]|uniref:hypothetical protein n=1 Tax=Devosia ginsengisoli TaxID=400770 RepID=UPI0026F314DF|nr:hypothetical protein [Devosia ginsengisoli]MCR6672014.1 hypothetical protein [Devosia ginsengisoli]
MPRHHLPPSGPAAPDTIEDHLRIGRRWLADAMMLFPDALPEDALAAVQRQSGPLARRSIPRYRADLRYALAEEMEAAGRGASFPTAWEKVDAALTARKATIPKEKRRTSAKKVVDAADAEARALFYELKRHGLKYENRIRYLPRSLSSWRGIADSGPSNCGAQHSTEHGSPFPMPRSARARRRPAS